MTLLTARQFGFASRNLSTDTFEVVQFQGTEGLSTGYRFEIDLVSGNGEIDLEDVSRQPATFTIHRKDGDMTFHGLLTEFEQRHAFNDYAFYRAVLVPKFHLVGLTFHNQVFLDMSFPEILKQMLVESGLTENDFELRLQRDYPKREYVCQYNEKHLTFISRWMERLGIYFYFEQTDSGAKLIVTDSEVAHTPMPEGPAISYFPPTGLESGVEGIYSFICRQRLLPKSLKLKDYNYERPSLEITGQADVLAEGRGEIFSYGEHFNTPEEAEALARIRVEMFKCLEKQFMGESNSPMLRPGYVFELREHYRSSFNHKYLTTELHHQGCQVGNFIFAVQQGFSESEKRSYYRNNFTAIPKGVQFRPYLTLKPQRIHGVMPAKIDAAGSGEYAELDDQGRYKVILPFDLSGREGGKASTYLRMAQPFAGPAEGFHFPLRKGTEVLLSFIDGNPDRPVISGAVPNPVTKSPVQVTNQTANVIKTSGKNMIVLDDLAENQLIHLQQACGNELVMQTKGREGEVAIRSFGGNEILMRGHGDEERIVITDHGGNKITMNGVKGDEFIELADPAGNRIAMRGVKGDEFIDLVDRAGNKIRMQGRQGAEKIEIADHSGNHIRLDGAAGREGITIQDKFGNKIVTDAVEGYMTLSSPSHDSSITLGKSIKFNTDSKFENMISSDANMTAMGASFNMYGGAKCNLTYGENFTFEMGLSQRIALVMAFSWTALNIATAYMNIGYTTVKVNIDQTEVSKKETEIMGFTIACIG